ncbi:MAG: homoserine O-acetyltransferase [Desulfobacterales bacterium]|nr:homoserine O-acetyltransferase [Desulfobacterales bacterium]MDJ0888986.1 homoserine O-acetyltransferase [Desulfobacterales bacterium]
MFIERQSVGRVVPRHFEFGSQDDPLVLDSGRTLGPVELVYETYGEPNAARSNAILICHALSGDAHAAGIHDPHDTRVGWWDSMIGPGKAFDTERYWVICANVIGGCKGSTGPGSTNPDTGQPFGSDFPLITMGDMVTAQKHLVDHLGIERLFCVAGGSMGGFQALEWSLRYPERVHTVICIAAGAHLSTQGIAFNAVGRHAITSDPDWQGGHYYGTPGPVRGLASARMVAHITYLSEISLNHKFGRRLQSADRLSYDIRNEFAVESYLNHQGTRFTERFDANSYIYITKAMDYFDIARTYGPLKTALASVAARYLVISYTSDWLFPTAQSKDIVRALIANDRDVSFVDIDSPHGHDAFLIETERLTQIATAFLDGSQRSQPLE